MTVYPKCAHQWVVHWRHGEVCVDCGRIRKFVEMSKLLSGPLWK